MARSLVSFTLAVALPEMPVWSTVSAPASSRVFWTRWTSVRKLKEGETPNDLFDFLTTEPNAEVGAVHPKAMPVILTTPEEIDTWLSAGTEEALALQRPLADGALVVVARGEKQDGAPAAS